MPSVVMVIGASPLTVGKWIVDIPTIISEDSIVISVPSSSVIVIASGPIVKVEPSITTSVTDPPELVVVGRPVPEELGPLGV